MDGRRDTHPKPTGRVPGRAHAIAAVALAVAVLGAWAPGARGSSCPPGPPGGDSAATTDRGCERGSRRNVSLVVEGATRRFLVASGEVAGPGGTTVRLTLSRVRRDGTFAEVAARRVRVRRGRVHVRLARYRPGAWRLEVKDAGASLGTDADSTGVSARGQGDGSGQPSLLAEVERVFAAEPGPLPGGGYLALSAPSDPRAVKRLQRRLTAAGFRVPATGRYGAGTAAAVRRFQARQQLLIDGIVGRQTASALLYQRSLREAAERRVLAPAGDQTDPPDRAGLAGGQAGTAVRTFAPVSARSARHTFDVRTLDASRISSATLAARGRTYKLDVQRVRRAVPRGAISVTLPRRSKATIRVTGAAPPLVNPRRPRSTPAARAARLKVVTSAAPSQAATPDSSSPGSASTSEAPADATTAGAPQAAPTPRAPATAPQAPATTPQVPATTPQVPATTPQAPATTPQAPATTPEVPAPTAGLDMTDTFTGPDGTITTAGAFWNPDDPSRPRDPQWEGESGAMYRRDNTAASTSPVFRFWTIRSDFTDVDVQMRLRNNGFTGTSTVDWDGVKIWLRRQVVNGSSSGNGKPGLYTAEVNRRQGNVIIQKKCGGVDDYAVIANTSWSARPNPPKIGEWERVGGTVRTNADGSVKLQVIRDGQVVLSGTDTGAGGCPPIRTAGKVGVRADNTDFQFDDFTATILP